MEERLLFEDFPDDTMTVVLFKDVSNSKELREQMLAGTLSPECCLVNAELVPELRVLHVAAHKALAARRRGALRTRTLHSELIFNLSGSKQIAETLGRFGINPSCKHILAARFDATPEQMQQLGVAVRGQPAALSELPTLTDREALAKCLKATPEELGVGSLAQAQLVRIACRDC